MPIHTIRNVTGQQLELWDIGNQLANLANGQSIHSVPVTITSVTRAGIGYYNSHGTFQHNDCYEVSFTASNPPEPATVLFSGNNGNISFT